MNLPTMIKWNEVSFRICEDNHLGWWQVAAHNCFRSTQWNTWPTEALALSHVDDSLRTYMSHPKVDGNHPTLTSGCMSWGLITWFPLNSNHQAPWGLHSIQVMSNVSNRIPKVFHNVLAKSHLRRKNVKRWINLWCGQVCHHNDTSSWHERDTSFLEHQIRLPPHAPPTNYHHHIALLFQMKWNKINPQTRHPASVWGCKLSIYWFNFMLGLLHVHEESRIPRQRDNSRRVPQFSSKRSHKILPNPGACLAFHKETICTNGSKTFEE